MLFCRLAVACLGIGLLPACDNLGGVPPGRAPAPSDATASPDAAVRELAQRAYVKAFDTCAGSLFGWDLAQSADGSILAVSAYGAAAVYVLVRTGQTWAHRAYLEAPNEEPGDGFGISVAMSADGSILAVGAPGEASAATGIDRDHADNSAPSAGAVYVFARRGMKWRLQAYIKAPNTGAGDRFGAAVALSGDGSTLAVGAPGEDSAATGVGGDPADDSAQDSGSVYVLARRDGTWSQEAYVKASNPEAGDFFGEAVAVSGDGSTLAVGARWEASWATGIDGDQADNSALFAGAVYVYTRGAAAWSPEAYVKASNSEADDRFGSSVALSADGSTLAVAATWHQQAYVKASNPGAWDQFGRSVVLSADGSDLAVGADWEASGATGIGGDQDDNSAEGTGAVYTFARSGSTWSQRLYIKASNTSTLGGAFGFSVALSADASDLAVGAPYENSAAIGIDGDQDDESAMSAGAVYLFDRRP
jgi:hypothetical protein